MNALMAMLRNCRIKWFGHFMRPGRNCQRLFMRLSNGTEIKKGRSCDRPSNPKWAGTAYCGGSGAAAAGGSGRGRRSAGATGRTAVSRRHLLPFFVLFRGENLFELGVGIVANFLHLGAPVASVPGWCLCADSVIFCCISSKTGLALVFWSSVSASCVATGVEVHPAPGSRDAPGGRAPAGGAAVAVGGILGVHGHRRREHAAGDQRRNHQCFIQFHIIY